MTTLTMKDRRLWIAGVVAAAVIVVAVAYFGGYFGDGATDALIPPSPEVSSPEG